MNIFFLDRDPVTCAQYHCDKHVVKMCLEYSQLLQTAMFRLGYETEYEPTHYNHPCALWVAESIQHWNWVHDLALCVNEEYKYRYGKEDDHKSLTALMDSLALAQTWPGLYPRVSWVDPPMCMPDEAKRDDVVEAYRAYYSNHKVHNIEMRWSWRNKPEFMTNE